MIEESDNEIRIGGVVFVDLMPNQMVLIKRCEHYDVQGGTIGRFVEKMKGGIAVEVDGRWKDAAGKWKEATSIVFISDGDYTPL